MADLSNVVRMLIHQLDATRLYLLPSYCDEDEKARAVIAFAESALAAEPPAPAPAADGEREELAALIEQTADSHNGLWPGPIIGKLFRAAALLRQLPPEGLLAVEYVHIDSGARIICEPNEECSGGHWAVLNSRHANPCTEFRTVADAVAALQQARQQEVGDD